MFLLGVRWLARFSPGLVLAASVFAGGCIELFPSKENALATTQAPAEVKDLRVYAELDDAHFNAPLEDFVNELQRAQIHIVRLRALPRDVEVTVVETRTFLQTTSEFHRHHPRHGTMEHIRRVLDMHSEDTLIDEVVIEWDSDSLAPTLVPASELTKAFLESPKLRAWAGPPRTKVSDRQK